ncbi:hypothetical protein ANN_15888 [Periplaneta americana]|uniref:Per a allergen n=1 Tax=Periplaneta americana TaxID=6978 RepID=A0ABQ8SI69_PERAM|nr:hypothetical protein ANN_15888 [Periplaneta americana]
MHCLIQRSSAQSTLGLASLARGEHTALCGLACCGRECPGGGVKPLQSLIKWGRAPCKALSGVFSCEGGGCRPDRETELKNGLGSVLRACYGVSGVWDVEGASVREFRERGLWLRCGVSALIGEAYGKAATVVNATSGFAKTGIGPLDRNVFQDSDFAPAAVNHTMTLT